MRFYEKILMQNIGISCMTLIIIFLLFLIANIFSEKNILSTEYLLSGLGLTVAFWYGYKKYERDKEIEMIERYSDKYNTIINSLSQDIPSAKIILWYRDLLNIWSEEYFLHKQNYISNDLWSEWEEYVKQDIKSILLDEFNSMEINLIQVNSDELVYLDNSNFLLCFMQYFHIPKDEWVNLRQSQFYDFISDLIEEFYITLERYKKTDSQMAILKWLQKLLILIKK